MKKLFLFAGLFSLLVGAGACQRVVDTESDAGRVASFNDTLSAQEAIALKIKVTGTTEVSEQEALEQFRAFASRSASKGAFGATPSIHRISLNGYASKGSANEVPFCYAIDCGQDNGYALVSADRRVPGVFAYTEQGSIADTATNNGLKLFVERMACYMEREAASFNVDSLYLAIGERHKASKSGWVEDGPFRYLYIDYDYFVPDPDFEYMGERDYSEVSESGYPPVLTKWSQGNPYNNLLPNVGAYTPGGKAYVGCAMVAVAQIMAYHKRPYGALATAADWNSVIANNNDVRLHQLMLDLFNNMKTGVSSTGTTSNTNEIIRFLRGHGYSTPWEEYSYSFGAVASRLQYGPVIVVGVTDASEGHAWVVDGTQSTTTNTYDMYEKDDGQYIWRVCIYKRGEQSYFYVRCNWGWSGSSDGWFFSGVFNPSGSYYKNNLKMVDVY